MKLAEQKLQPSLEDRVKEKPTQPSKKGPRFTDLYVNIHGKHYLFKFSISSDGTPDMYEDKITGLLMPKGIVYEINPEQSESLLGEKVYAHIQKGKLKNREPTASEENREPTASEDFDFYLELEHLKKPDISIAVIGDERSTDTEILQRELYHHLRRYRYRKDELAVLSAPKKADQVVQNGNPLSLYHPSPVKGFDWRKKSLTFEWRYVLPVTTPKA